MSDGHHLLIVDDDRGIRDGLKRYLSEQGFRISVADAAPAARKIVKKSAIDLAVLDIMMPGENGLSLCRYIRDTAETPVILLTALSGDADRIVGLEIGADDYVVKPFNPRELLARIKAVMRRLEGLPRKRRGIGPERYAFDGWTLETAQRELVGKEGVVVPLSTGELRLLIAFIDRPNLVLSRQQLLDITRGRDADPLDRSIDNQISRLRRKIESDPKSPRIIKTVWGGGYSFAAAVRRF